MGCGSSAVEDPSTTPSNKPAGKPVHNSSDTKQKETVNKTKQEQPPSKKQVKSTRKKNDLKLNFDDLEDIDQHARTVFFLSLQAFNYNLYYYQTCKGLFKNMTSLS